MPPHIAIIGAGIAGVTTAYELISRGFAVTVFESEKAAGLVTSYANGGQISASNAEAWNSWHTVLRSLSWVTRRRAPLAIDFTPGIHKYSWLAEFIGSIRRYKGITQQTVQLALAARARLNEIADKEAIEFDHQKTGILHFYKDHKSFEAAHRVNHLLTTAGLERYPVGPAEINRLEPAIAGPVAGGFYTPDDQSGDMHRFTLGLAARCAAKGVDFRYGRRVCDIIPLSAGGDENKARAAGRIRLVWQPAEGADISADAPLTQGFEAVVICAGCASRALARRLGDRVNIYPVKGYSLTLTLPADCARAMAPEIALLDERAKIVSSRLGARRYRVAGLAEIRGCRNSRLDPDAIARLEDWVRQTHPALMPQKVIPWAGLRPTLPDMMPAIRPGRHPGIYYNTGHGHLGWTLSAASAGIIASLVAEGTGCGSGQRQSGQRQSDQWQSGQRQSGQRQSGGARNVA